MSDSDWWPADYFASRERFVELARAAGARTHSHAVEARGPGGEPLSVDTAVLGPERPEHLIVLTSGVHGVEGFLGAAVQVRALQTLAREGVPDRVGIALVHAVNPWGFAHLRRVDENNVDVNRNFIDPTRPRPAPSPGYASLDPLINPRGAPEIFGELRFWRRAVGLIARERGIAPLAKAIAEGQDRFPEGLFFGGVDVGASCGLLQRLLLGLSADAGRVTHLDLHSGLGRPAVATLITGTNIGPPERRVARLRAHYGQPVTLDDAPGNPYDARGTLARWYRRALGEKPFLYLCVEVGTVNPLRVLSALRRENQAHHRTAAGSAPYVETKRALLAVFSPRSRRWREKSVAEGLHTFARTLALPTDPDDAGI